MNAADHDLEDLFENAPCAYLLLDPKGHILRFNRTLLAWTGSTAEQLTGKRFQQLLTIGTRILYETSYAPLLSIQGSFDEISLDLMVTTGGTLPVSGSGTVQKDASGRPVSVRIVLFKSSERRRYERQLVEAHEQVQGQEQVTLGLLQDERATAELREQFIAVLGHDLRNPLAAISGGIHLLKRAPTAERQKLLLEMLEGSVVRMSDLIANVLDFARGRLGAGIPLELRPDVQLRPLLEQAVSELRLGVPNRVIECEFDLPQPIKCDPSRISQLVSNLLGNALTHGDPEQPIRMHADNLDGALTLWVANGGRPIPPEAMASLFRPFFRGEVRSSQQGLGLGLHIALEIAKAHDGTIHVTSTAEETRFVFVMPTAVSSA